MYYSEYRMKLVILLALLVILVCLLYGRPQDCAYNSTCNPDECAVSDARGGMKCVPKKHDFMVWESQCLKNFRATKDTRMEAPLDIDGSPDFSRAVFYNIEADRNDACAKTVSR
jgi:hypothetical protein